MGKFDIYKSWKPKKRRILARLWGELFFILLVVGVSAVLTVVAIDAYEKEQTGKCEDCVLLGGYYEWRSK